MGLREQTLGVETDRDRQGQILGSKTDLKGIGAEHCDWPLMGV